MIKIDHPKVSRHAQVNYNVLWFDKCLHACPANKDGWDKPLVPEEQAGPKSGQLSRRPCQLR